MKLKKFLNITLMLFIFQISANAQNLIGTYTSGISFGWTHSFNVTQGNQYLMVVSGEFSTGTVCPNFEMDPAYWIPPYNGGNSLTHSCNSAWFIQGYCNGGLGIRPTPDVYNPLHSYDYLISANSNNIVVGFTDGAYGDNCGLITFTLYEYVNCSNTTLITPQTNNLLIGSTATFTASTSDPNPSYVWQSDFGQGFQNLNNFGNYSGINMATLNIANVQLSEHNQPIRVISTSGNCIDTSNVAIINILDTCIVAVYDTLLTTVTDTLVINTQITGINPPNNLNMLKVFPNPASTHITIDYGNFIAMSGYTLTIVNSVGQTVFTTPINQQTSYIDLSTWTGNGIYFVQLIDPQNNTIENRKIVIQ
jgi:hypothetical protein